ncbi:hypothetical protein B0H14DRAFT_3138040 [Mycena olivaceomarginata]|nr:hypothetical protein B0H14DRAFT_3138040 [Mycena olivaceomarginata]
MHPVLLLLDRLTAASIHFNGAWVEFSRHEGMRSNEKSQSMQWRGISGTLQSTHTPAVTAASTLPVPRTAPLLSVLALSASEFDSEFATPDGAGASTVTMTSGVAGGGVHHRGRCHLSRGIDRGSRIEKKVLVEVLRISEVLEVTGGAESELVVAGGGGVLVVSGVVAGGVLAVAGVVLVVLGGGGAAAVLYSIQEAARVSAHGMERKGKEEKGSMDVYMDGRALWDTGWSLARRIRPAESGLVSPTLCDERKENNVCTAKKKAHLLATGYVHSEISFPSSSSNEHETVSADPALSTDGRASGVNTHADAASRARPSRLKGAGTARTREPAVITTERRQAHDPSLRP